MKYLLLLALSLTQLVSAVEPLYHYQGEVSGVVCQVCSGKVKHALESLPGVANVKLKPSKTPGTALIQLDSSTADLSKEAAIKALGADSVSYTITSFKRSDS